MAQPEGNILIVDDDASLRRSLSGSLIIFGFTVGEAVIGEDALVCLRADHYDTVLLDINMPGAGGIETLGRIRRSFTRLPVLMLTVRSSEADKVQSLEAGADDYVTKPFQVRELAARVRASIRRYHAPEIPEDATITVGDVTLDPIRHLIEKAENAIHLTPLEFEAMKLLQSPRRAPRYICADALSSESWGRVREPRPSSSPYWPVAQKAR